MRLGNVIIRDLDVSRIALLCAVGHGQVALDGICLTREDLNAPIEDFVPGSLVTLYSRRCRVNGSRLHQENHQPELA